MPARRPAGRMETRRLAAGLTLEQVAVQFCRSAASVRRWETGQTTPSQAILLELARTYGCKPADLVAD